jgi:predicted RNA-binding protein
MSEQQAWIIVADRTNMETCSKVGVYGLNSGSQLPKMKVGDKLVAYIRKETTFAGVGEVTKEYYLDNKPLFEGGLFPNRVGIKLELLPKDKSVNCWSLTDDLEFSKGKLQWQGALAGGMRRIPMSDYQAIEKAIEQQFSSIR